MIENKSGLTTADLAKLAASGISAALAEQAQLRRVDSQEGGTIIGRKGCSNYAGVVFPYISAAREYRLRRDQPVAGSSAILKPGAVSREAIHALRLEGPAEPALGMWSITSFH